MMSEKHEQNMICIYRCGCRFIIDSPNGDMTEIPAFSPMCCPFGSITSVVDMKLTSSDKPKYQTLTWPPPGCISGATNHTHPTHWR
jgi:hypothetical protein